MKLNYKKYNYKLNLMIVTLAVCISIIYNYSGRSRLLNVFRNNSRELPIYCVDTAEKKIAISFDAAWGDIIYLRKEKI
ncbi:MAG TPA: hypothetical protein PLI20_09525 [Bacillota bacterium]|nr:hypothetical protein [Bacillota bacterium]